MAPDTTQNLAASSHGSRASLPPKRIAAVVVTYHPDTSLPDRIARLLPQVDHLIIVDNHSSAAAVAMLQSLASQQATQHTTPSITPHTTHHTARPAAISLILNNANLGIARALNQGFESAIQQHCTHVLTMDQDSIVEPSLIATLNTIFVSPPPPHLPFHRKGRVAIAAPNYIDSTRRPRYSATPAVSSSSITSDHVPSPASLSSAAFEVRTAITSGSLISVAAWQAVGGFREDFFIDSVDHDFCFRIRKTGLRVIQSAVPLMRHTLGGTTRRVNLLFVKPAIANYAPVRRYYMTRNRIAMLKAHWRSEPASVARETAMIPVDLLLTLLFEKDKLTKARAFLRGIHHGLRGRMGPS